MEIINKLHDVAIEENKNSITAIVDIILTKVLTIEKKPNVLFDDSATRFDNINNIIYINTRESIYKDRSIFNIAHECFHIFQNEHGLDLKYDEAGRKIIEWKCSEYGYSYKFEVEASAFALSFTNFYIAYILEYNYKHLFEISAFAKNKYPILIEKELEIKKKSEDYYNKYITTFEKYKEDIKNINIDIC